MKKNLKKSLALLCLVAGGVLAAETRAPAPELVATAEFASFGDVSKKLADLGALIGNPLAPTLLVGAGQERLVQAYGRFRNDAPFFCLVYRRAAAAVDGVVVYPCVDGPAKMLLDHPGATKDADGTLRLPADGRHANARWVAFAADRRVCAFARTASLARRALADFAASAPARAARKGAARPLVRIDVTEAGLRLYAAQVAASRRPAAPLADFAGATLALDLDARGLAVDGRLAARPGAPAGVGAALPAAALDRLPDAPLFAALAARFACDAPSAAAFRADMDACAAEIETNAVRFAAQTNAPAKAHGPLVRELAAAAADLLRTGVPCPAAADWSGGALVFDARLRPALVSDGEMEKAGDAVAATTAFYDRVARALARQWPKRAIFAKADAGYVVDWAEAIDVGAELSGLADGKEAAEARAAAKRTVAAVLGDTKAALVYAADGTRVTGRLAAPGVAAPRGAATGEARVAAALPETAAARPCAVFYASLYALAREAALPILARVAPAAEARMYAEMRKAMPPAAPNSAVAGAAWAERDGSVRGLARITAGELKNYGAAFNAFTMAALSSGAGTDDDGDVDGDDE